MDTQGISMLEYLWKVVESIADTRLRESVHLHDVLHDLRLSRRMGVAILEIKLSQKFAIADQDPLLLVFLDLQKA